MSSEAQPIRVSIAGQHNGWGGTSSALVSLAEESVSVSHFVNADRTTRELQLETSPDHYRVSITLRGSKVSAQYNGHQAYDGKTMPGMVHIAEPSTKLSAAIQSPGEALHLFLPTQILVRLGHEMHQPGLELKKTIFRCDPTMGFLAKSLAENLRVTDTPSRLFVDGLCTAAVATLVSHFSNREKRVSAASDGLIGWRLKRVQEFVDAHLEHAICLKDLADTAGLSQMHFASQFRRACGVGPHEYLVQQRVERSKDLLGNTESSLLEIALAVGFTTHSHFTNTFRRHTGVSPAEWRKQRKR